MLDAVVMKPETSAPQHTGELTEAERRLLEICQRIQFGRLLDLHMQNGQPLIGSRITVERDHKYGSRHRNQPPDSADFALKDQQRDFIERLRATDGCQVVKVQIQHGMPFRGTTIETIN